MSVSTCVAAKAADILGVENVNEPQKWKDTCADWVNLTEKILNKYKNVTQQEKKIRF